MIPTQHGRPKGDDTDLSGVELKGYEYRYCPVKYYIQQRLNVTDIQRRISTT